MSLLDHEPLRLWTPRPDWMDHAACRGHDTEDFFPTRGELTATAKAICMECPVRAECGDYGAREKHGIWGGMSERQRRRKRHERTLR